MVEQVVMANPTGNGWLWVRAFGQPWFFDTLSAASRYADDIGIDLVVLDRRGRRMN